MTNQIQANTKLQIAYLAGGCYWGLEELIRNIPGVVATRVGFSGGDVKNVSYFIAFDLENTNVISIKNEL